MSLLSAIIGTFGVFVGMLACILLNLLPFRSETNVLCLVGIISCSFALFYLLGDREKLKKFEKNRGKS